MHSSHSSSAALMLFSKRVPVSTEYSFSLRTRQGSAILSSLSNSRASFASYLLLIDVTLMSAMCQILLLVTQDFLEIGKISGQLIATLVPSY